MTTRRFTPSLAATAAAVFALSLAACGGGSGEAPPQSAGNVVNPAAPVVTITNDITAETATGPITFTFSFNRDVGTSFTADDVVVTGGTKGAFTLLSGTSATLVVTPTADSTGMVEVSVPAGSVTDAVGTANAETLASKAYDTTVAVVRTPLVSFEETPAPALIGFGGAEDATVVADPTNPANKVARIVKSGTAELWAGTTVAVCPSDAIAPLPFSSTLTTLSARVWSPVAGIPVRLKVENAADPTQTAETEATVTVASGWQTLTFNFATPAPGTAALNPALTYNKASVFFNFGTTGAATGERTYYIDDLAFVGSSFTASCTGSGGGGGGGGAATTITMDEATPPVLTGFGGAEDATIVADPTGGTNKVARVVKSGAAELWAGTTVSNLPGQAIAPIGFSSTAKTITVRVWSPAAGIPVRLKVENAADPTKTVETEATVTTASAWQTLTFNFANPAAGTAALDLATTYNKVSIFFNFGTPGATTGARTYYFEDISYPTPGAGGGTGGGGGGGTGGTTTAINFESATPPTFTGFGGAEDASVVVDPTNAANKVARIVKSGTAELWAGTTISTLSGDAIPRIAFATGSTTITARVWSPAAGIPVRMKVENAGDPTKSVETEATVTTASGWQTLSFNFANQAAGTAALDLAATYNRLSVFFNFGTTGATTGARTYYIDDIVYPAASGTGGGGGGGGTAGTLVFASGYRAAGATGQGGTWGYFSGDFSNYANTYTGGGFADSTPPVADDAQYFYIAVTTSAPTAITGSPPSSGGFLGMYVTHPGLALTGQTTLAVNLGMDANFFQQTSNKNIDVFVVGSTTYSNGSSGNCNVTLKGSITPTTDAMITYTVALAGMTLVQPCSGGGFNSGVSTVAQALAQPIGAVNTQFTFPNVNTTINSGTSGAPVFATGLTRGKTEFR
ncbi:hypothetical protein ACPOLB_00930 [Rubrivivax sp. RP6-9]|uniref:hypothetical protein n=1 Tax=Rubrivivax sp. RP6-9 TaxID=3415750 RepID=UPI003CC5D529